MSSSWLLRHFVLANNSNNIVTYCLVFMLLYAHVTLSFLGRTSFLHRLVHDKNISHVFFLDGSVYEVFQTDFECYSLDCILLFARLSF